MSAYFISPFKPPVWAGETDLRIAPEDYINGLKSLWPDVNIISEQPKSYVLWWELRRDGAFHIMGGLQEGYNVVSIEGNKEYIAEFAVWHRAFVPPVYRLYFFHESLTTNFELEASVTKQVVLHRMS